MYISLSCLAYRNLFCKLSRPLGICWFRVEVGICTVFRKKNCPASTHSEILVNHRCFMNMCIWPKISVNIVVIRIYIYIWSIWVWLCVHTQCVCVMFIYHLYTQHVGMLCSKPLSTWVYTQNEAPENRQEITSCSHLCGLGAMFKTSVVYGIRFGYMLFFIWM